MKVKLVVAGLAVLAAIIVFALLSGRGGTPTGSPTAIAVVDGPASHGAPAPASAIVSPSQTVVPDIIIRTRDRLVEKTDDTTVAVRQARLVDPDTGLVCGIMTDARHSAPTRFLWVGAAQMLAIDDGSASFAGLHAQSCAPRAA
ncbi:hypothetical protein G4G27_20385 [Sphingomonas sp. So64.6b]|uniref:hypothetical protein n=1 Tax=Sphingomonas sp. So64.6b TaxID=2997354 RepID=UPI00160212D0|nr:hypothetical protein [Sphingomonas sp. So64.6b]QNA86077.1 hypothetical protein G4G27_20385 [Sphingomonas sp. So64.6b]